MENGEQSGPTADWHDMMDVEEFRRRGKEMVDFICDYYTSVASLPVRSQVEPGYLRPLLPENAPEKGEPFDAVMHDVRDHILPGVTHWQSPSFFAYYPANSSFPGILGEMLSAAFNAIGFSWIGCPAATELETVVLDWLGRALGLPERMLARQADGGAGRGGGVIQGTASEAVLVALLAARARAMTGRPPEDMPRLVAYTSDQAHSAIKKACMVAGVVHCRLIQTTGEDEWRLQPQALEAAIEKDVEEGLLPFFLCATVGTTSTAAVDPLPLLGPITQNHGLWFHVDGAYAGVAAICPEHRDILDGLQLADSFGTNCHKWLLTNFDCSPLWVADAEPLKQALSLTPPFLRAKGNAFDYKDWQVPLGRRFRALKLWFVMRTYGLEGLQSYLRHHMALARDFATLIEEDPRFELAAPMQFSLVCFRLKGASNEENAAVLEAVNASGKAFLISTEVGGQLMLRLAVGARKTQLSHVRSAFHLLCQEADRVLAARTRP